MALSSSPFGNIFTFTRSTVAQDFDLSGALVQSAINAIRQGYDPATLLPAGWLLEGASTNLTANARGEGGTAGTLGSGGVGPTGWSPTTATGLSFDVAFGTEDGFPCVDYRVYGTPGGNNFRYAFGALGAITDGVTYTGSVYARLLAGTLPGDIQMRMVMPDETGQSISPTNAPLRLQRFFRTRTPSASGGTGRLELRQTLTIGTPVDYTLRLSCPMLEANYFASSLILPVIGSPAATSRAADALSISNFAQIFGASAPQGFVIVDVMLPQQAGATAGQPIIQIGVSGDTNNRVILQNQVGGAAIITTNINAGTNLGSPSAGTFTPNVAFRAGIRWGAGTNTAVCANGGVIQTAAGIAPAGMNEMLIGRTPSTPLNGRIRGLWAGSFNPSDARFQAACSPNADVDAALRS